MAYLPAYQITDFDTWMPYKIKAFEFFISKIDDHFGAILLFGSIIAIYKRSNNRNLFGRYRNISLVMFQEENPSPETKYVLDVLGVYRGIKKPFSYSFSTEKGLPIRKFLGPGPSIDFFIDPYTDERINLWEIFPDHYKG